MRIAGLALLAALAPPAPPAPVALQFAGGTVRELHAYAAPAQKKWLGELPHELVVRWLPTPRDQHHRVRITCVTKGCDFAAVDQPHNGDYVFRIDRNTFDVRAIDGAARIRITIATDTLGEYTIQASPSPVTSTKHDRNGPPIAFSVALR